MKIVCTEELKTRLMTFRPGEEYIANIINDNWTLVDSVGVSSEDFNLHFEVVDEEIEPEEEERDITENIHRPIIDYPEPDINLGWLGEKEDNDKEESFFERMKKCLRM